MNYLFFTILVSLTVSSQVVCQEESHPSFLKADNDWSSEIIVLPVDWAPGMTVTGYEELLFAPGWSDPKSDCFWSLVMGWKLEARESLDTRLISENLKYYYDGLMKPNHWATEFPDPIVYLDMLSKDDFTTTYTGKLVVFDGFHTGKIIELNIRARQQFDKDSEQTFIIIQFSTQSLEHTIWKELGSVVLKT
ncbi:hypothetical protein EAX61_03255 [Dokdonia sinensis]|uniref:Uncharacterized protein n=1 Tax=Dokdonia sinensis TaxID=2479847 RepID=A0A3M0GE27_9FLAO|nr:hypothetical protein [Dokdonia sinensis]RMB63421.1 hypothetical protein EAX61_03255 [Dokdonia sinensis]